MSLSCDSWSPNYFRNQYSEHYAPGIGKEGEELSLLPLPLPLPFLEELPGWGAFQVLSGNLDTYTEGGKGGL